MKRQYPITQYKHFDGTKEAITYLRNAPPRDLLKLQCLCGHAVHYGMHEFIPKPYTYVGIIRDPIERCISQYYFYKTDPGTFHHEEINKNNLSLEDFLPALGNHMLKTHLGLFHPRRENPTSQDLKEVCAIIERDFSLQGTTELFDETLYMMGKTLGWPEHFFWIMSNKGKARPKREEVPERVLKKIKEANILEYEFYTFCKERFQNTLQQGGQRLKQEIERYKVQCALFSKIIERAGSKQTYAHLFHHCILQTREHLRFPLLSLIPGLKECISECLPSLMEATQNTFILDTFKNLTEADVVNTIVVQSCSFYPGEEVVAKGQIPNAIYLPTHGKLKSTTKHFLPSSVACLRECLAQTPMKESICAEQYTESFSLSLAQLKLLCGENHE